VDEATSLHRDQILALHGFYVRKDCPEKLWSICFYDREQNRRLVVLTKNFTPSAPTVAWIYKCRWQIELFFKWIKQHLRIEVFYGTPMVNQ
jgi:IS4 transposase